MIQPLLHSLAKNHGAAALRLATGKLSRAVAIAALPCLVIASSGCQTGGHHASSYSCDEECIAEAPSERTLLIADTYAKQGQSAKAAALYTRLLRTNPSNVRAAAGLHQINPELTAQIASADIRDQYAPVDLPEPPTQVASLPAESDLQLMVSEQPPLENLAAKSVIQHASFETPESPSVETEFDAGFAAFVEETTVSEAAEPIATEDIVFFEDGEPTSGDPELGLDLGQVLYDELMGTTSDVQVATAEPIESDADTSETEWTAATEQPAVTAEWAADEPVETADASDTLPPLADALPPIEQVAAIEADEPSTSADVARDLPKIRPFGTELAGDSADEADASGWAPADELPTPDLTPTKSEGWAASVSPRPAPGKHFATVPQLLELTYAESINTPQLLTAQAACESPSDAVRLAAAEAILTHRPTDAVAWATVDELLGGQSTKTKSLGALMLGALPAKCHGDSLPRLVSLLRGDDVEAKSAAALAIGGLGTSAAPALDDLRTLASGPRSATSEAAAISLSCLGRGI